MVVREMLMQDRVTDEDLILGRLFDRRLCMFMQNAGELGADLPAIAVNFAAVNRGGED